MGMNMNMVGVNGGMGNDLEFGVGSFDMAGMDGFDYLPTDFERDFGEWFNPGPGDSMSGTVG